MPCCQHKRGELKPGRPASPIQSPCIPLLTLGFDPGMQLLASSPCWAFPAPSGNRLGSFTCTLSRLQFSPKCSSLLPVCHSLARRPIRGEFADSHLCDGGKRIFLHALRCLLSHLASTLSPCKSPIERMRKSVASATKVQYASTRLNLPTCFRSKSAKDMCA